MREKMINVPEFNNLGYEVLFAIERLNLEGVGGALLQVLCLVLHEHNIELNSDKPIVKITNRLNCRRKKNK